MIRNRVTETPGAVVVAIRPVGDDPAAGGAHVLPGPRPGSGPSSGPGSRTETERYWQQVQELRAQLRRLRPAN